MKKYVTWKAKKVNDNCYQHPNTDGRAAAESNGDINFIETPYQGIDGTYVGIAEHEGALPQSRLDALMIVDTAFEFYSATEVEVNAMLLESYGLDGESNPLVSYLDYAVTDLRPDPII